MNNIVRGNAESDKKRSIAQEIVAGRFGPDKKDEPDMLGSFIRHGLTQTEAESNTLMQMYSSPIFCISIMPI